MVKNNDSRQTVLFVLGVILLMVAFLPACAPAPYGPYDRYGPPSFEIPAGLRVGLILAGLASLLAGWAIYRFVLAIPGFIIGALMGVALAHNQPEFVILLAALFFGIIGAAIALALIALGALLEHARLGRLTRNQHILFRLGEWIAQAESAAAMARHAADGASALDEPREGYPFTPPVVQAMSRLYARETALHIATAGLRWMVGTQIQGAPGLAELEAALNLAAIYRAQQGLLSDADLVARAL